MQSIKNTTVSIILLFLSYGVYQVITKPIPSELEDNTFGALEIAEPGDDVNRNMIGTNQNPMAEFEQSPPIQLSQDTANTIPPQLLDLSGNDELLTNPHSDINIGQNSFNNGEFSPAGSTGRLAEPSFPVASGEFETDSSATTGQTVSFSQQETSNTNNFFQEQHFESDTQINPTTVMSAVASKPANSNDSPFLQQPTEEPSQQPIEKPKTLTETWPDINEMVENAQFQQALIALSKHYRSGNVDSKESEQLLNWLDALAAKVIYSSEHHLRSVPYIIQPGDTIASLARQWQVPAQLIYNINSSKIPDPNDLTAGVEIKLIQGPFDAEIDSQQGLMTLYLENMYAGRFTVQSESSTTPGEFQIVDKSAQGHSGQPFWIGLNNGMSIFAAGDTPTQQNQIGMSPREAEEVFSILSAASKIRVLR